MTEERAAEVLRILRRTFAMPKWTEAKRNPFETLIVTIISQNTADRNTAESLRKPLEAVRNNTRSACKSRKQPNRRSLKVAGLYKNKAKTIKQVSKTILETYHGTLAPILSLPLEEARKVLTQFSGIGPKTADVVLLFSAKQPTIPVDTHVNRVAKRLGLAPVNGDYETVRKNLQLLYNPSDYLAVHILLIAHGRKYCKARRPLCEKCPVNMHCPSKGLWDEMLGYQMK